MMLFTHFFTTFTKIKETVIHMTTSISSIGLYNRSDRLTNRNDDKRSSVRILVQDTQRLNSLSHDSKNSQFVDGIVGMCLVTVSSNAIHFPVCKSS